MPATPWIAGAIAAAMLGGAAAGMSVNTTPIERFSDPLETIPRHQQAAYARQPQANLPNHYAMETPQGTLSVSEVFTRRTQLNPPRWQVSSEDYRPDPILLDDDGHWVEASDKTAPEPAVAARNPLAPALSPDARPLEPVGDAPVTLPGATAHRGPLAANATARVIDVRAELAGRN